MLPRGERNYNIGNIDFRPDRNRPGQVGSDGRCVIFETPEKGVQAAVEILHVYRDKYGINTLSGMIQRWAPPSENNTANYIAHMERHVGIGANEPLNLNDPVQVAKIIAAKGLMENGAGAMQRTFTPQVIARGVKLAFDNPSSITGQRHTPTTTPAGATQVADAPGGAGTGRVETSATTPGGVAPASTQTASAGGSGGQGQADGGQPQGPQDMLSLIVVALLAMFFNNGTQMAQAAPQPQQDVGNISPSATPPAPRQAAQVRTTA